MTDAHFCHAYQMRGNTSLNSGEGETAIPATKASRRQTAGWCGGVTPTKLWVGGPHGMLRWDTARHPGRSSYKHTTGKLRACYLHCCLRYESTGPVLKVPLSDQPLDATFKEKRTS